MWSTGTSSVKSESSTEAYKIKIPTDQSVDRIDLNYRHDLQQDRKLCKPIPTELNDGGDGKTLPSDKKPKGKMPQ
ncbi:hypothetical protein N7488_001388 [Penicillium malachiteum]|nr:hypothetical protein N7488_001388 [Penicillium malachiteum]